jgi:hypothetical protein
MSDFCMDPPTQNPHGQQPSQTELAARSDVQIM